MGGGLRIESNRPAASVFGYCAGGGGLVRGCWFWSSVAFRFL